MTESASSLNYRQAQLADLATQVLDLARRHGATAAEAEVSEGVGQAVSVRLGEVETIEYTGDKGVGVTVYLGQSKGHASSSDFSAAALEDTVKAAINIARFTAADPFAGLADPDRLATEFPDLSLCHPWSLSVEDAIELARATEAAGQAVDARVNNSEGASVNTNLSQFVYANSHGFCHGQQGSRHSLSTTLIAQQDGDMQRDYWYSSARHPQDLLSAAEVGRVAGERAVRRLDARRVKTGQYPVLFEAPLAAGLIGHFVSAVSGGALYRKMSFLVDSLGQQVFSPLVHIDEDPFIPRGIASGAFDNEGVATCARTLVADGVAQGYFLSSYSARKLGMASTGHAGGCHNLLVRDSGEDFAALLQKLGTGLLVTELLGHGVNTVTGDYSRGAAGFWVENGVLAYPVEEITIAGNLKDMFRDIIAIGSDQLVRGATRCGSILLSRMTVAGE
jgi:PmbA protein